MTSWRRPFWATAALTSLVAVSSGRGIYGQWEAHYNWSDIEPLARLTAQVTPPGAPLWADEPVYFLTRRDPPSGMEFAYSHAITTLPAERARQFHVLPLEEIRRQVEAGVYSTIETCEPEYVHSMELPKRYRRQAEFGNCAVYWDRIQ